MLVGKNNIKGLLFSNGLGLVVSLVTQAATIPVFVHFWGAGLAGAWIALNSIGALLSTTDLGFYNVIGSKMVAARLDGKYLLCAQLRNELINITIGLCILTAIAGFAIGYSTLDAISGLDLGNSTKATGVLFTSLTISLFFVVNLQRTLYRVCGRMAYANVVINIQRLAGFLISVIVLWATVSFALVALSILISNILGLLYLSANLDDEIEDVGSSIGYLGGARLYILAIIKNFSTCFSASAFTICTAIITQSITVSLAWNASGEDVIEYNSYRIMGRGPLILATVLAQSIWPKCAELYLTGEIKTAKSIFNKTLIYYFVFAFSGLSLIFCLLPYVWPIYVRNAIDLDWHYAIMAAFDSVLFGYVNIAFFYLVSVDRFKQLGYKLFVFSLFFGVVVFWCVDTALAGIASAILFSIISVFITTLALRKIK